MSDVDRRAFLRRLAANPPAASPLAALGACADTGGAAAIGRPYLWGLGAFGQGGVERTLEILDRELELTMRISGTGTLADIGPASVGGPA